jgi:hypothetical protein
MLSPVTVRHAFAAPVTVRRDRLTDRPPVWFTRAPVSFPDGRPPGSDAVTVAPTRKRPSSVPIAKASHWLWDGAAAVGMLAGDG